LEIGTIFGAGAEILDITNPRVDSAQLDSLRRTKDELATLIEALESKKEVLEVWQKDLSLQKERFRVGRIKQLATRVSETETQILAAKAEHDVAVQALARANKPSDGEYISQSRIDKAVRDDHVTQDAVNGLMERRQGMLVELEAARSGTFIGDSYNDTPQSAQRSLDIALELADVEARLAGARKQLANGDADFSEETKRHEELTKAALRSSVKGRIWEVMTSPGEHVIAGQELRSGSVWQL
jgi:biotin carboxyl carrier protein